jgi:hypothetical protein
VQVKVQVQVQVRSHPNGNASIWINRNNVLRRRAKQWLIACWVIDIGASIVADGPETSSELSKIAKLNGDFRRNYGTLLGAFLYLRSINAARGRSWFWAGSISLACSAAMAWLGRHGLSWLSADSR